MTQAPVVKNGKVISINYVLRNSGGEQIDQSEKNEPFTYLHGASQIVKGLEQGISDLKVGDKKKVVVSPKDGYGEVNPKLKLTLKRDAFPDDVKLEAGMQFEADSSNDGNPMVFTITDVKGDDITIDGNHPLAGETLHFEIEVVGVRDATADEKQHGHAHGAGGHNH
jgi:FKBP-type peptidyl-prolyl cis-trans isomerase SlyD